MEKAIQANEDFINETIRKKYTVGSEKNYDDIVKNRYTSYINKKFKNQSDKDYVINMLSDKRYVFGGSIAFGLENEDSNCSYSNCYFIPIENDSLESIYKFQAEAARTFSFRGGVGVDITVLRPKDSQVKNAARFSSGAVSFMPSFSECVNTIGQNGRRGALIITIDVRHPDVEDFIKCKSKPEEVFGKDVITGRIPDISGANISVKLTDKFMKAVENDDDWNLIYPDYHHEKYNELWDGDYDKWINKYGYEVNTHKTIKARDLLYQLSECAWVSGDPGVLFFDTMKNQSTGLFDERLTPFSVNPCGEQCLGRYNNCLLSSLVLYKYVKNPYQPNAEFDMDTFLRDVEYGIRLLDHISDDNIDKHPLKQQRENDEYGKRLGQEITGLADTLAMLNIFYGSDQSYNLIDDLMFFKATTEIETSAKLAKEKGHAPCFNTKISRKRFLEQPYIQKILNRMIGRRRKLLENTILEHGLRNSAFNTVGPTGTISIVANNCSSGIEPIFALEYYRKSRIHDETTTRILHYPLLKYSNDENILKTDKTVLKTKYHYVEAADLSYSDRIKTQSVVQKWTDSSVSSTVNLPNDIKIDDIFNIYFAAWKHNLKGITIFRDGCKTGVLSTSNDDDDSTDLNKLFSDPGKYLEIRKKELDGTLRAYRTSTYWKNAKVYITVAIDNKNKPVEVFASVPYECGINGSGNFDSSLFNERLSNWNTICRLTSILLRLSVPIPLILKQLQKAAPSMVELPALIARILSKYENIIESDLKSIDNETDSTAPKKSEVSKNKCPNCLEKTLIFQGGCYICTECGYSKCS